MMMVDELTIVFGCFSAIARDGKREMMAREKVNMVTSTIIVDR